MILVWDCPRCSLHHETKVSSDVDPRPPDLTVGVMCMRCHVLFTYAAYFHADGSCHAVCVDASSYKRLYGKLREEMLQCQ